MRSLQICYKLNSWGNQLVVRRSPAGKNMSMKAQNIVGIRHQETTGEDTETEETYYVLYSSTELFCLATALKVLVLPYL
jgi:hypothetical protein